MKITFKGLAMYFNQNDTMEVQKKRKQVRDIIKKLKEKNVKEDSTTNAAKLKVLVKSGMKTFTTLTEAALMLKNM